MIDFGTVRPGTTLYIPFATYDSNDPTASVTMTGLAVTDIEIYKDGGTTQRASDAGYTLLGAGGGIDFDGITGIHGFSIDLADNTTAGFYAAGSQYWVVVSSITVDAGTINFIAATFRIGYPDAILNTTIATLASQTSFTLTAGPADNNALVGCVVLIHDVASAVQMEMGVVSAYTGSTRTVTLAADPGVFTAAATDNIAFYFPINTRWLAGTALTGRDIGASVLLSSGTGTGQLDITSGVAKANVTQCAGGTVPAGAIPNAVAGAAGGLFIAGTNAAVTVTTSGGSALTLSSTGANGSGLAVSGNGSGHGILATGGATGNGLRTLGGATSGAGLHAASQGGTGPTNYAIYAVGNATGADTGGMYLTGGATGGDGLECVATGNGHGLFVIGAGTGDGIHATSGGGSGAHGMHCQAVGTGVSHGLMLQGNTGGDDLYLNSNDAPTLNLVTWGSASVRALTSDGLAPITSWTVAITGNITGNLSGSVGSVTGAVGSVTGNVGGNVTGSVGSVTGAVGSVTGNVTGSVGSLATQAKADVNAEVVDVLRTDTLPDDYPAHEAQPTFAEAILAIHQFLFEREVSGTTVTIQKPDGTTTAMTLTLDSATNPTTTHRSA